MKKSDKIELSLIALAVVLMVPASLLMPRDLAVGEIALSASALLLAQGLARDIWLKYGTNRPSCDIAAKPSHAQDDTIDKTSATCMCMESSLGIFGIIAGVVALLGGNSHRLTLPSYFWPLLVLVVCLTGFMLKSLVIDWKTKRIRVEHDHSAVHFHR